MPDRRLRLARAREWGSRTRTWSVQEISPGAPVTEYYRGPLLIAAIVFVVLKMCPHRRAL